MRRTEHYKNSVVDALARERTDAQGWTAEVCVMQNDADTPFFLKETFPSAETAIDAALQSGRHKVDAGIAPNKTVQNLTSQ